MFNLGIGLGIGFGGAVSRAFNGILSSIGSFSVSRASTRTVLGYATDAVIADGQTTLTIPVNVPAVIGARKITNLLLQSQTTAAPWVVSNLAVSPNSITAPDGTLTADTLEETAVSAQHQMYQTVTSGTEATFSFHVKDFNGDRFFGLRLLQLAPAGNWETIIMNPRTGAITSSQTGFASSFTNVTADVVQDEDDPTWYRVYVSADVVAGTVYAVAQTHSVAVPTLSLNGGDEAYLGVAGNGVYIWQGDYTETKILSDPIVTTTATSSGWSLVDNSGAELTSDGISIGVSGENASTADDIATIPVPSVFTTDQWAMRITLTPTATGQTTHIASIYTDATHTIDVYASATEVIAEYIDGATTDSATFSYTHTSGTKMAVDIYGDSILNKIGVRAADVADIESDVFATGTYAGVTSLPSGIGICNKNGASVFKATVVPELVFYESAKSAYWG